MTPGRLASTDPDLAFGEGLRRITTVARFLCGLRDGDVVAMTEALHPDVTIAPIVGVTSGQGYSGRVQALQYMADTRRDDVHIEPDLSALSVTANGAVLGRGQVRLTMRGDVDQAPAEVVYEFRDGLIISLKGHLTGPSA